MLKVSNGTVTLTRGDTARLSVDLADAEGNAYEMAPGDTLALTVKRSTADADALISKESKGSSAFVLDPSDTSGLAYGRYRYDVQLTTAGGVTSVDLPAATSVGSNAFQNCTSLPELTLPQARVCDTNSFRGCTSLVRLALPRLSYAGWTMAVDCTALEVFDTGTPETSNPSSLGSNSFQNCTSLVAVVLRRTNGVVPVGALSTFSNTPIASGAGYVYVPAALVDKYKAATNWSVYADQIRAIEDYPEICDPE